MRKEGKIWGETTAVFEARSFAVHVLRIAAGGFCSEHQHGAKSNTFYVISGRLAIDIWRDELVDRVILEPGEATRIEPGVWHRFEALDETLALEIYEVALSAADIARRSHGGRRA